MKAKNLKSLTISFGLAVSVFSTALYVPALTNSVYAVDDVDGDVVKNPYTQFETETTQTKPNNPTNNSGNTSVKSFTIKSTGQKYVVISAKSKTVKLAEVKTKKTSVTIPSTVTYKKVKYKVVTVGKNAFKKSKKVKKVTIGKNVKKIETKAFYGCTKLKLITIKSKSLNSVGKNAFKKISKNAKIKVPAKKLKAYRKLFKKKGQASSVKITK